MILSPGKGFILVQILRLLAKFFPVRKVETQKDKEIFTKMWSTIWIEEGYYDYLGQPIIEEFSKYDRFSIDLIVKFLGIFPAGTFRFIRNNDEVGLPVLNDFEVKRIWSGDNIVEATLLTVPKKFRRLRLPFLILMRELARYGRNNNLEGAVMMVDRRLFFLMRRKFKFPIHQIGSEKFYQGSITFPAYINNGEFHRVMRKFNPFFVS